MYYLLTRGGRFYYNRHVPNAFREFDPSDKIRVALKTDSRKEALRLALAHNDRLESYWNSLAATGAKHCQSSYIALVDRERLLGFSFYFTQTLEIQPVYQIVERLNHVEYSGFNEKNVEAVLGKLPTPVNH